MVYGIRLIIQDMNEDRHMHNIAVLMKDDSTYRLCPVFDNGASLLSDTKMDCFVNDTI